MVLSTQTPLLEHASARPPEARDSGEIGQPGGVLSAGSSLSMALLMQAMGHATARLLDGAVIQQSRSTTATATCTGMQRLDLFGVGPMVLSRAADRIAVDRLVTWLPVLENLLADPGNEDRGIAGATENSQSIGDRFIRRKVPEQSSQVIVLYRQEGESTRQPASTGGRGDGVQQLADHPEVAAEVPSDLFR